MIYLARQTTLSLYLMMLVIPAGSGLVLSQPAQIVVDGDFSDWQAYAPLYVDPTGDTVGDHLDFGSLWMANDDRFLFLNIEMGVELAIQDPNDLVMYLDTDNESSTGMMVQGIGAELIWRFGAQAGSFIHDNQTGAVQPSRIGVISPTVTSTQFEIAIDRRTELVAGIPLFMSDTLRIVFRDERPGADRLPDEGTTISYGFNPVLPPPLSEVFLDRQDPAHVRVLSYNVLRDGLFERQPPFSRILKAVRPDIIGFQEVYNHSAARVAEQVEAILPSSGQAQWYSARIEPDIVAVSRFSIAAVRPVEGGNGVFRINLRPRYDSELLLIVAHPPCCDSHNPRQIELDAMMELVREVKTNGFLDVEPETPILLIGDMNLVGPARQQATLLTGDIEHEDFYGPDFAPDWDDTELTDLVPTVTGRPMVFTWYQQNNVFSPGRLDYIIYSDSVLEPGNRFVLFTPALSDEALAMYGLQAMDVVNASDHLPVVGDFVLPPGSTNVGAHTDPYMPKVLSLEQNYPNPLNTTTTFRFDLSRPEHVTLVLYNQMGQEVAVLLSAVLPAGRHRVVWDAAGLASGTYLYRLQTNTLFLTRKLIVSQ